MQQKFIVLKPTAPVQIANATLKIKQGQVVRHPGYEIDPDVFEVFDDAREAQKAADRNAQLKTTALRHGITDMKTLAHLIAREAKEPTAAEREAAFKNAKILTEAGLEDPVQRIKELEAEISRLKTHEAKISPEPRAVDSEAYLDQTARTVVKKVEKAVKKGQLRKEEVEAILEAEKAGKGRKTVVDTLKDFVKNDAIFGKFFKK